MHARHLAPLLGTLALVGAGCRSTSVRRSTVLHPAVQHVETPGRKDTLPFSHGILAGDFYFVSGTLGVDPSTGKPPADPVAEARLMLDDFRAKLALVGLDMQDLVQVQVYCTDLSLYESFNQLYAGYFPGGAPTRAFVGAGSLLRGCRFEIVGIAARR